MVRLFGAFAAQRRES